MGTFVILLKDSISRGMRMEKCASMIGYSGGTMIDLKDKSDPEVKFIKFEAKIVKPLQLKTEWRK